MWPFSRNVDPYVEINAVGKKNMEDVSDKRYHNKKRLRFAADYFRRKKLDTVNFIESHNTVQFVDFSNLNKARCRNSLKILNTVR